ncbi:hypothetical protein CYMTET_21861 [Cymbomonas tetramitiformis]|uniref:Uncharacterized protein ycf33 n=1 Tax=Cymbomonas tetramitiformis TaxID=36881 RepID=A0AAE0L2K5_9CHLO|nr:hypothetical protein CYMTET_21861 [Cymbomonas tetramitiformis]
MDEQATHLLVKPAEEFTLALAVAFAYMWLVHAEPASAAAITDENSAFVAPHAQDLWSIAEGEDFWANMGRYAKYAVTVVFGTGYVIVKPLFKLFSKPQTAIPFAIFIFLFFKFIRWTVQSMLGLNDVETIDY